MLPGYFGNYLIDGSYENTSIPSCDPINYSFTISFHTSALNAPSIHQRYIHTTKKPYNNFLNKKLLGNVLGSDRFFIDKIYNLSDANRLNGINYNFLVEPDHIVSVINSNLKSISGAHFLVEVNGTAYFKPVYLPLSNTTLMSACSTNYTVSIIK